MAVLGELASSHDLVFAMLLAQCSKRHCGLDPFGGTTTENFEDGA